MARASARSCGAWNTLIEQVGPAPGAPANNRFGTQFAALAGSAELATLSEIEATDVARTPTGIDELDRVLGGGIVDGGVVLIGGDPGIGKSTLLLQAVDALQHAGCNALYVTGEESGAQVALRVAPARPRRIAGAGAGRDPAGEDPRHARRAAARRSR